MVDQKVKVTFQVKAVCLTIISPQVQLKDGNNSESPSQQLLGLLRAPSQGPSNGVQRLNAPRRERVICFVVVDDTHLQQQLM